MSSVDVHEIEISYVNTIKGIKWNTIELWPIFKSKIHSYAFSEDRNLKASNYYKQLLRGFFYGLKNIFRINNIDYYFFSNSNRKMLMDGKYEDRVVGGALNLIESSILFENPIPIGHFPFTEIRNKNIISDSYAFFIQQILIFFFKIRRVKFSGEKIIEEIFKDAGIKADYKSIFYRFLAQYYFMKFTLKFHKPKVGIFVCSYVYFGYILAFKEKKIKTVEFQHGLINATHAAYNYSLNFGNHLFPDFLFTYGKDIHFNYKNFILKDNIFSIGYYYLQEKLNQIIQIPTSLGDLINEYNITIAFTGIVLFEEEVIEFLNSFAIKRPDILILYIPRYRKRNYNVTDKSCNLFFIDDETNTYDIIKACKYHSTTFSTCALEALALGKPNILYNFNGLAQRELGPILQDNLYSKFVNYQKDFENAIQFLEDSPLNSESIKESITGYFDSSDQKLLLKKAFENVID